MMSAVLKLRDAKRIAGLVETETVKRMSRRGAFPPLVRVGEVWWGVDRDAFERWLASRDTVERVEPGDRSDIRHPWGEGGEIAPRRKISRAVAW